VYTDGDHEWIDRHELDSIVCDTHYRALDEDEQTAILVRASAIRLNPAL
jgi:hypothetical protein